MGRHDPCFPASSMIDPSLLNDTVSRQWPGAGDTVSTPPVRCDEALCSGDRATIDGPRYREERVLGQGGMGVVRLVDDALMGRQVAMKVMQPEVAATQDGRRRFLREARVQGLLEHPAVVPVYDLGQDQDDVPWFTMKRVRGVTLEQILAALADGQADEVARFPRRRLLGAFVQVCLALDFAHSRGVVHRDLKPGNVMLGDFGDVHVLDWGLAQVGADSGRPARDLVEALHLATRGGSVFGTPGYMAPEQIRSERVDARADVYSLGAILFELLTLEPLHPGTPTQRLSRTLAGDERSPRLRAPQRDVPPELDAVVLAATAPEPAQRLASARELAQVVERFLDGDRDLEVRHAVALQHVAAARAAAEHLDTATPEEREVALRQLLGALALEPSCAEALGLLRRVLTHVPQTLPPVVEQEREARQGEVRAGLVRSFALRMGIWLGLTPLVLAMGPTDGPLALGLVALLIASAGLVVALGRKPTLSRRQAGAVIVFAMLSLSLFAALFGHFILVPPLVATGLVMSASQARRTDRTWLIALGLVAVLVPPLLEQLDLVAPAYEFTADRIVVLPRLVHFPPLLTQWVLVLATVASVVMPGVLAGRLRDRLAEAERRLLMMAWQLESLGQRARV